MRQRGSLRLGVGLAVAGALVACQPAQKAPPAEPPSLAAQLDPCQGGVLGAEACKSAEIATATGEVSQALAQAASVVSPEGAQLLVDGQKQWAAAAAVECGVAEGKPEAQTCLATELAERKQDAAGAVQQMGGFTFQRVESVSATATPASVAAQYQDAAPAAITREISYPRIDGVSGEGAAKFNEIMAKLGQPRFKLEDQTSEITSYTIAFASKDLISVEFTFYESTIGAAHGNGSVQGVTVLMGKGATLTAEDVFKPNSGWENLVTKGAMKVLKPKFKEMEISEGPELSAVKDTATKAHNWVITTEGLKVLFSPYSIGPFAMGSMEAVIPWADLKAVLNPAAPAPITQG
jgi:hypothetical protein